MIAEAAPVIGFRVSDPNFPADVGDQLLPFNATRLQVELWHGAGRQFDPAEIQLIFEQKAGLGGTSWRAFPVDGHVSSSVGKIQFVSANWPDQITGRDEQDFFSYRVRVLARSSDSAVDHVLPFGRAHLPVYVTATHVYDIDRPTLPSDDPTLPGDIKRLGIDAKLVSPLEELDTRLILRRYRRPEILWEKTMRLRTNTPLSLSIDPLPPEVVPAPNPTQLSRYTLTFECVAQGAQRSMSWPINVGPVIPPGAIRISSFGLADHPLFQYTPGDLRYSDLWDRMIASVEVVTSGYDPHTDPVAATATLYFYDHGRSGEFWYATAPIQFEPDGTGWAYINNPFLPPLDVDGKKEIRLVVNHNNRTDVSVVKDVPCVTGFRPDRIVDVRSAVVVEPNGTETKTIRPDSRQVRVDFRVFRSLGGPRVMLTLVLCALRRNNAYRSRSNVSNAIAFQLVSTEGTGIDDVRLDFDFPQLSEDLFRYNAVAPVLIVAHRADGIRHTAVQEAGDFTVAKPAMLVGASSVGPALLSAERPKPPIPSQRLSGAHWCAKFPTSASTATLQQPFRKNVQAFITMLERNGGTVRINATLRPPERAYLMQWAFKIARQKYSASLAKKYVGVDIVWNHKGAVAAAEAMVKGYDIAYEPAGPTSKHCTGHAVDMTITNLPEKLTFKIGTDDKTFDIGKKKASENRKLWNIASKYFSVAKLADDAPHWYAL